MGVGNMWDIAPLVRPVVDSLPPYFMPKPKAGIKARLASNESPLPLPSAAVEELAEELRNANRYPASCEQRLEFKLAEELGVDPTQVLVGAGSDQLLDLLIRTFVDAGDRIAIPIPTFPMYEFFTVLAGGKPIFVRRAEDFSLDVEKLRRAARNAKLAFIASPNNPTGNASPPEDVEEVAREKAIIALDEAYVDFADGSLLDSALSYDNIAILRTFSKAFGLAGLRVGYMVGSKRLVGFVRRARPPFSISSVAARAAEWMLENPEYVRSVVELVKRGRAYLTEKLGKFAQLKAFPSKANFLLVDVRRSGLSSAKLAEELASRGILIRDCTGFRGLEPGCYIRVTIGAMEENELFVNALEEILS